MDQRISQLEGHVRALESQVGKLTDTLLGTLDGKPGLMKLTQQSLEVSQRNSVKLDDMSSQVEGIKLNWAKVTGIALATSSILGVVFKFVLKI